MSDLPAFTNLVSKPKQSAAESLPIPSLALRPETQPRWLIEWTPAYGRPEVDLTTVKTELAMVKQSLRSCGVRSAALTLEKVLAHFGTPNNWSTLVDDYMDEISNIPNDLLPSVWADVRRYCRFFPKIPEILATVDSQICARNLKRMRLETMISLWDRV